VGDLFEEKRGLPIESTKAKGGVGCGDEFVEEPEAR
jgi:hypothetical protein